MNKELIEIATRIRNLAEDVGDGCDEIYRLATKIINKLNKKQLDKKHVKSLMSKYLKTNNLKWEDKVNQDDVWINWTQNKNEELNIWNIKGTFQDMLNALYELIDSEAYFMEVMDGKNMYSVFSIEKIKIKGGDYA